MCILPSLLLYCTVQWKILTNTEFWIVKFVRFLQCFPLYMVYVIVALWKRHSIKCYMKWLFLSFTSSLLLCRSHKYSKKKIKVLRVICLVMWRYRDNHEKICSQTSVSTCVNKTLYTAQQKATLHWLDRQRGLDYMFLSTTYQYARRSAFYQLLFE